MKIQLKNRQVPVTIRKSTKAKYMRAAFSRDYTEIVVTQPKRCSKQEIEQFIVSQVTTWANKNDNYVGQVNLLDLQELPILGMLVKLSFIEDLRNAFTCEGDSITIMYRHDTLRERLLRQALFEIAEERFDKWCNEYADALGVNYSKLSVKDISSRWGSCSKSHKSINLSFRLIFAPEAVARYVCAHEVAHLVHANHSQDFWDVVAQLDVDYSKHRKWLRENSSTLHGFCFG